MGIEPTSEAWEASILPLYDARSIRYFGIIPKNLPVRTDSMRGCSVALWTLRFLKNTYGLHTKPISCVEMFRTPPNQWRPCPFALQFVDEYFAAAFTLDGL